MTTYTPNLLTAIRSSKNPVFSQDIAPIAPSDCPNCGGIGTVYLFVTTGGPFRDPPSNMKGDQTIKSVTDEMYGWVWYIGRTLGDKCPVCHGLGRIVQPARQVTAPKEIGTAVHELTEKMKA